MGRRFALLVAGFLIGLAIYLAWHKHDVVHDDNTSIPFLVPTDAAKIVIDPTHHKLITVKRAVTGGVVTHEQYLPHNKSAITIEKDGTIHVETRTLGTEIAPFVGLTAGSRLYAAGGLDLFYVGRVGFGLGVFSDLSHIQNTRGFVAVQYNVYDSVSLGVGVDNAGKPLGLMSFRF